MVTAGLLLLVGIILSTVFAPSLAPYDPIESVGRPFTSPCVQFVMGTDNLGRDIYSRVLYGATTALEVAAFSTILSVVCGIPLGLFAGFVGGMIDRLLSVVMDSIYAFPGLVLAIAITAMLGPGVINMSLAITLVYVPTYFRIIRGQVMSIKEEAYIEAAKALGANTFTILYRYVLPNIAASIIVVISFNVADAILTEAGLSFLGLGVPPPTPDWGYDLSSGKTYLPSGYWWVITFPGLMIIAVVFAFTLLGEGLDEALNPHLSEVPGAQT
jgi:peptide/nickel transport system permease protein